MAHLGLRTALWRELTIIPALLWVLIATVLWADYPEQVPPSMVSLAPVFGVLAPLSIALVIGRVAVALTGQKPGGFIDAGAKPGLGLPLHFVSGAWRSFWMRCGLWVTFAAPWVLLFLMAHVLADAGIFADQGLGGIILDFAITAVVCFFPLVGLRYAVAGAVRLVEKLKENPTLRRWFVEGRGGSSRWAGPATFDRHAGMAEEGIYLGRTLPEHDQKARNITYRDDGHLVSIGNPGSGKSVSAIWPNVGYGGSVVYIDPKGEHFAAMGAERAKRGDVFNLDPFLITSEDHWATYNVLSEIDLKDPHVRSWLSAVSRACVFMAEGDNRFWSEMTIAMLEGGIVHVLSTRPVEDHNLPAVADMLLGVDPQTRVVDPQRFIDTLAEMAANDACGGLAQRAARMVGDLGERAYGNVMAELSNALKWCTDPMMRAQLAHSSFSYCDVLASTGKSVFIVIPLPAIPEQSRWLRCHAAIAMRAALRNAAEDQRPRIRSMLVLDELPQYGRSLMNVKEALVTLRDAKCRLWCFVQNYGQLEANFDREGARNFESGATMQCFGVSDAGTAGWISNKLGRHRVKRKVWVWHGWIPRRHTVREEEVPLMDPAGVTRELQKGSTLQYVFPTEGLPMRLRRCAFKPLRIAGNGFRSFRD